MSGIVDIYICNRNIHNVMWCLVTIKSIRNVKNWMCIKYEITCRQSGRVERDDGDPGMKP